MSASFRGPFTKEEQLKRGAKRKPRIVATRKQWAKIRAAKLEGMACAIVPCGLEAQELHHIVSRGQLGDDVADNCIGVCRRHHALITEREPGTLALLAECLTDAEEAYAAGKVGPGWRSRLFGIDA